MKQVPCPKCGWSFQEEEQRGIRYGRCKTCDGLWFDSLALDALFAEFSTIQHEGSIEEFMSPAFGEASALVCGICDTAMMRGTQDKIAIDWCGGCSAVFLDHGELEKLLSWRKDRGAAERRRFGRAALEELVDIFISFEPWLSYLARNRVELPDPPTD